MKKAAIGLLLLALGAWYFIDIPPPVVDFPRDGQNIIAFGDSLVVGHGASPGNDFVSILSDRLDHPIINAGRNGDTTQSGLERLQVEVLSQDPRIVILLLGGNDALRRMPMDQTFSRLADMIDQIHQTGAAVVPVDVAASADGQLFAAVITGSDLTVRRLGPVEPVRRIQRLFSFSIEREADRGALLSGLGRRRRLTASPERGLIKDPAGLPPEASERRHLGPVEIRGKTPQAGPNATWSS